MNTQIKFAQRPISGLRLFNEPEISASSPSRRTCLSPEKNPSTQPGLKPRTSDFEASTLPRDHRGRHGEGYMEFKRKQQKTFLRYICIDKNHFTMQELFTYLSFYQKLFDVNVHHFQCLTVPVELYQVTYSRI